MSIYFFDLPEESREEVLPTLITPNSNVTNKNTFGILKTPTLLLVVLESLAGLLFPRVSASNGQRCSERRSQVSPQADHERTGGWKEATI
jgi:hypothetical protein